MSRHNPKSLPPLILLRLATRLPDMLHPEYPVVSFLSVFLLLCSAPSHFRVSVILFSLTLKTQFFIQARNVATISLILWLVVLSIIRGVDSIAWADNVEIKLLVWCDISKPC